MLNQNPGPVKYTLSDIESHYIEWMRYLSQIGLHAFFIGLACLGMGGSMGMVGGFLGFVFLIVYAMHEISYGPNKMRSIADSSQRTTVDMYIFAKYRNRHMSYKAIFTRHYVYLFGWLFLGLVTILHTLK